MSALQLSGTVLGDEKVVKDLEEIKPDVSELDATGGGDSAVVGTESVQIIQPLKIEEKLIQPLKLEEKLFEPLKIEEILTLGAVGGSEEEISIPAAPPTLTVLGFQDRRPKKVCFSDIELPAACANQSMDKSGSSSGSSGRKSIFPFQRFIARKNPMKGKGVSLANAQDGFPTDLKPEGGGLLTLPTSDVYPSLSQKKHEDLKELAANLSSSSIKSRKLETKLSQSMRLAFFDYEAKRTSEEWNFRKQVEALELEYHKKFLNLMGSHNDSQRKLHEKFIKKVRKTEKRLKKEALQGHLNEGSCFNVSQNINHFKINQS